MSDAEFSLLLLREKLGILSLLPIVGHCCVGVVNEEIVSQPLLLVLVWGFFSLIHQVCRGQLSNFIY